MNLHNVWPQDIAWHYGLLMADGSGSKAATLGG